MGTNFRIIDLGVILVGIGCMTVVLTAGFNSSNTAYRIKCQDNLKKIGVALSGYASKNNDVLPVVNDRDNWKKIWCLENSYVTYLRLKPHAGTRAKGNVLEGPGESRYETFTHIGYVMNVNLHTADSKNPKHRRGGKLSYFSSPSTTIAATDGTMHLLDIWKANNDKNNVTRARHDNQLNVLLLDGSVTTVPKILSNLDGYDKKNSWLSDEDK